MDFIRETDEFKTLLEKYESLLKNKFEKSNDSQIVGEEVITEVPFTKENGIFTVNGKYQAKVVINATGVMGDLVNELVNNKTFDIMPRKGQYFVFDHFKRPFVNHTLFMVPTEKGKGVLISPTTSGNYLVGPSAHLVSREEKTTDKETLNNVKMQANYVVENIPYYETNPLPLSFFHGFQNIHLKPKILSILF